MITGSTSVISCVFCGLLLLTSPPVALSFTLTETAILRAGDLVTDTRFGVSVAIDGDTALIGAPFDESVGNNTGSAYVFVRNELGIWTEQAKLTAGDPDNAVSFGRSVSISGDTALIGANGRSDRNIPSGSAYVFVRDEFGVWTEQAKLTASASSLRDGFGWSVSIDGNSALIGAFVDSADGQFESGSAYVFVRDELGNWTEQARLVTNDAESNFFGQSVAVGGNTALIGSTRAYRGGGAVYVFARDESGNWSEQAKLRPGDVSEGDIFGNAVSIDGNSALILSPHIGPELNAGAAYVFVRDERGSWTEQAKLTPADAGSFFGYSAESVAIDNDTALVGATGVDTVYVFTRTGTNWTEEHQLIASDSVIGDDFGISVAIDGATVLVGALFDDESSSAASRPPGPGSTYVLRLDGDNPDPDSFDDRCNLLTNGSFDRNTNGWWTNKTDIFISADSFAGRGALIFDSQFGLAGSASTDFEASPGQFFTITGYTKIWPGRRWAGLGVDYLDAFGNEISEVFTTIRPTENYRKFTLQGRAPSGTAFGRMWIASPGGRLLRVDELSVLASDCK